VINDKLQGSVAAYLSCGWVFNYHFSKSLSLNLVDLSLLHSFLKHSNFLNTDILQDDVAMRFKV